MNTPMRKHRRRSHHFLAAWIRSPLQMGSLFPSSGTLARAMAAEVDVHHTTGTVVELGAGTGVVTHALLRTGMESSRLVVVERDVRLHALLTGQFHGPHIMCADATKLDTVLAEIGAGEVSAVVSSLPLLSMPGEVREAIVRQMASVIGSEGLIVQFTYGPRSPITPIQQRKHHLQGKRTKLVVKNLPPAHVWVYKKLPVS